MSNFETLLTEIRKDTSGKSFEVFCKWFLENDPYWKTQVEKVWLWDDWPERWGADKGIDLVFKHKSGQNWAIQSKCYFDDYYIKKEDIDSFLSESNRKNIHQRLLIGSTDRIGKNARETMSGQEKPVRPLLLSDLKASGLDYPSSLKKLGSKGNKKKINKDRPYQQQAIKKVVEGFKSNDRGKLIMACGTGKTLVTLWIKEKLKPKTTLVLLPSLNLLSQTLFEWTTHSKDPFEVLCICSDTTVGKQDRNEDMKVTDAYFDVTSDISTISQFLKLDKPKVVFCTYQSSDLVSKAQKKETIDFVVCDEAHRCTGLSKSTFTKVLDDKNIKAKKRLFTTATPRIFSSSLKTVASKEDKEIYGMDDEKIYGPDFFEYTFGQAINDKWLTNYQVVIVGVDEPTVKASIDQRELIAIDDNRYEDAETLASKISVAKAIKDYDITRMITFHNRVKEAKNFSKDFHEVLQLLSKKDKPQGTIWTDFISGQMSTKDRKLKLQQLKELSTSDRGIISNAKCLSEGVDVPTLDGVAFVEPKGSQIDIIQSVGRALRKSEEKKIGTIILPVFLNKDADEIKTIENSNFKPVWDVLKALRSHDERLSDELDDLRINIGKRKEIKNKRILKKIKFDLPKLFETNFSNSLKTKLVKNVTEDWMDWYGLLTLYVDKYNQIPSQNTEFEDKKLGSWCASQRQNYKKEKLSIKKINLLEKFEVWNWSLQLEWMSFKDARTFIHSFNLKSSTEWRKYTKSKNFPDNIPKYPNEAYQAKGWISWGDWLGNQNIATYDKKFKSFEEAKKIVSQMNLKKLNEWREYTKSKNFPEYLPKNPDNSYKNKGWISWGDFLGSQTVATFNKTFKSFEEAKKYICSLNLKSVTEWRKFKNSKKFPFDMPKYPDQTYKNKGWISWSDWLGTEIVATQSMVFREFKLARKFARTLRFKNQKDWHKFCSEGKRPLDIPSNPQGSYKDKGWISWGDWLGTNNVATSSIKYKPFKEARKFIIGINLKNQKDWKHYTKSKKFPVDIPKYPNQTYKNKGWISWGDWLGTGYINPKNRNYRSFEEARKFIRNKNFKSLNDWRSYCSSKKKPDDIPSNPHVVYKNGQWVSWYDWLGKEK